MSEPIFPINQYLLYGILHSIFNNGDEKDLHTDNCHDLDLVINGLLNKPDNFHLNFDVLCFTDKETCHFTHNLILRSKSFTQLQP